MGVTLVTRNNLERLRFRTCDTRNILLLQITLEAEARIALIVCCSPAAANATETLSSLWFGYWAERIMTSVQVLQSFAFSNQVSFLHSRTHAICNGPITPSICVQPSLCKCLRATSCDLLHQLGTHLLDSGKESSTIIKGQSSQQVLRQCPLAVRRAAWIDQEGLMELEVTTAKALARVARKDQERLEKVIVACTNTLEETEAEMEKIKKMHEETARMPEADAVGRPLAEENARESAKSFPSSYDMQCCHAQ